MGRKNACPKATKPFIYMNTQNGQSNKDINPTIRREDGAAARFLLKKTERLVAAAYLVSDLLSDNDPLKWKLRDNAISFLDLVTSFVSNDMTSRMFVTAIGDEIEAISGLLEVGVLTGGMSQMNVSILKKEFDDVYRLTIEKYSQGGTSQRHIMDQTFFEISEGNDVSYKRQIPSPRHAVESPQEVITSGSESVPHKPSEVSFKPPVEEHKVKDASQRAVPTAAPIKKIQAAASGQSKAAKSSRRDAVLKILAKKNGMYIKDISSQFADCSEKTIQRELNTLIKDGLVRREGERRWSIYYLVRP